MPGTQGRSRGVLLILPSQLAPFPHHLLPPMRCVFGNMLLTTGDISRSGPQSATVTLMKAIHMAKQGPCEDFSLHPSPAQVP